jgi:hypothetical protein
MMISKSTAYLIATWLLLALAPAKADLNEQKKVGINGTSPMEQDGDSFVAYPRHRQLELPPGSYQQLIENADEQLPIVVKDLKPVKRQKGQCPQDFVVTARVTKKPTCSSLRFKAGETFQFNTYYVDMNDPACYGFVGADDPPLLAVGWCGTVYLDDDKRGRGKKGILELAAYGKSFVATKQHRQLELPPGSYGQLKAKADERLQILVEDTQPILGGDNSCYQDYAVTARVTREPTRTSVGFKAGERVTFNTYYVNLTDPTCEGFSGAAIPPLSTVGWCGKVYLNDLNGLGKEGPLELAAYGKSFEVTSSKLCMLKRRLRGNLNE